MPSSESYLSSVIDLLSPAGKMTSRRMMGEYLLYLDGKLFGGIYDDRLLLKNIPVLKDLIPEPVYALPYEGAKEMVLIPDPERFPDLPDIVRTMCQHL